jgi:pimeloyl-ACP methyl ester carboxylesterase
MDVVTEKATPQSSANGVETLTAKVGDDNIFLRKAGKGPPVLLLHGGACDSSDWVETMVPLSDSYTFYAPDLVGYGLSDRNRDGYYLSDFTNSTKGLMEALGLDSPLIIVGHSLGGRVALELAFSQSDKVRKLVLIDTTGFSRLARWGTFLGTMAYWIRRLMGRPQPHSMESTRSVLYGERRLEGQGEDASGATGDYAGLRPCSSPHRQRLLQQSAGCFPGEALVWHLGGVRVV